MSRAKYHSELRQQQAAATRQAIVDAGRALFIEKGYATATIAEIAARAGVAVPTVYASVGPKSAILDELRQQMPADAGVAPADVGVYLSSLDDPQSLIAGCTAAVRRLIETSGDLLHAIEAAAQFEPIAARAWEEGLVIHRSGWTYVCQRLVTFGTLQPADTSRAADIMSMISLPQSWRTLYQKYGWSYDEIEGWIIATSLGLLARCPPMATTPAAAHPIPTGNGNARTRGTIASAS